LCYRWKETWPSCDRAHCPKQKFDRTSVAITDRHDAILGPAEAVLIPTVIEPAPFAPIDPEPPAVTVAAPLVELV